MKFKSSGQRLSPLLVIAAISSLAACSSPAKTSSADAPARADQGSKNVAAVKLDAKPREVAAVKEVEAYDDVPTMTASSDLVIRGRVTQITPGRHIGSSGMDGQRVRDVAIKIEQVFLNKTGTTPATVTLDEWGWDDRGHGFQIEGVTWSNAGDENYYFLRRIDEGRFRLVSTQGRVSVKGSRLSPTAAEDSPVHEAVERQSETAFRASLRKASADYRAGRLRAVPVPSQ
ncbi:hypothetical protein GCM10023196_031980 [Actinoallomurus vinaceus]|uniref:Lipoprotein n=1 Tax=Actinoallomurus vinaceus TaxID=1080074 RepID=A0ABP8UB46_9ACTN